MAQDERTQRVQARGAVPHPHAPAREAGGERIRISRADKGVVARQALDRLKLAPSDAIAVGDTPPASLRAYLMVDTYPAATSTLSAL